MPMSPRLLRPKASGLIATDPDARAYISAVQIADASSLEPAVQRAINGFVVGCKADGIWTAIKASCILMGARTLSGALTPLVGSAPTNNNFVSGDYNRKTGLVGNGSTKYLNTNRNNNADPQNSQHGVVYASSAPGAAAQLILGTGGADGRLSVVSTGGNFTSRSRSSLSAVIGVNTSTGFIGVSRGGSASYVHRIAGTSATVTQVSQTPLSENIGVFATTAAATPSDARLAFYSIGESLDLALLDARVSTLYTAIGAAIP